MTHRPDPAAALAFIRAYHAQHGIAQSLRELAAGCGLSSTSVASAIVARLAAQGALRLLPGKARGIVPVERGGASSEV